MSAVVQDFGPCPCSYIDYRGGVAVEVYAGCGIEGTKLTRFGHLVGCECRSCIGRRNRRKGQRGQARMHKRLGGEGFTPTNEESARPYEITVAVMPESKTGQQIPASWDKFIDTDWFRRALGQSARAVPVGSGVLPAVVLRGDFVVIDIRKPK